jgi:hypothetical protein
VGDEAAPVVHAVRRLFRGERAGDGNRLSGDGRKANGER